MKPKMKPCQSSMVQSIGYDQANSLLYVEYNGGKTYTYDDVDLLQWVEMNAEGVSIGKYINANIKPHHKATKLDE